MNHFAMDRNSHAKNANTARMALFTNLIYSPSSSQPILAAAISSSSATW